MSWAKTKLQNLGAGPPPENISISGNDVESADNFVYLNSLQPSDGQSCRHEETHQSGCSHDVLSVQNLQRQAPIICNQNPHLPRPCLALCIRNVDLTSCRRQVPGGVPYECQRQILGIRWFDCITNQAVSNQIGLQPVASLIKNRRVAPFGHIARLPDNVPAHQALLTGINLSLGRRPSPHWRRPPGRPTNRGLDQIRTDTGSPPARNARGYHPRATQRSQLATRQ